MDIDYLVFLELDPALRDAFPSDCEVKFRATHGLRAQAFVFSEWDIGALHPKRFAALLADALPEGALLWKLDHQAIREVTAGPGSWARRSGFKDAWAVIVLHESYPLIPEGGSFPFAVAKIVDDGARIELGKADG
jgi:hypothetical protein